MFGRGRASWGKRCRPSSRQRTLSLLCSRLEGDLFSRSQPIRRERADAGEPPRTATDAACLIHADHADPEQGSHGTLGQSSNTDWTKPRWVPEWVLRPRWTQAFQWSAMHPQPPLTCTTHCPVQAPGRPSFSAWSRGPRRAWAQQGGTPAIVGVAVLGSCPPRDPQRLCAGRQAGFTLGSDRDSHSLVGFLLELPEGREKGSEKGQLGPMGRPSPTPETRRPPTPA